MKIINQKSKEWIYLEIAIWVVEVVEQNVKSMKINNCKEWIYQNVDVYVQVIKSSKCSNWNNIANFQIKQVYQFECKIRNCCQF